MKRMLVALAALLVFAGCGGGSAVTSNNNVPNPDDVYIDQFVSGGGITLGVLKNASGTPIGVRVSWTRVDVTGVQGYFIYRDTSSIPDGDPSGYESLRVDADGNPTGGDSMFPQSGSGTETLHFDDLFSVGVGDTFYYRLTVVNSTSDESDFSNQLSITIAQHTITTVSQAGGYIGDQVTIDGTNFGQTRNGDKVYFSDYTGSQTVEAASYVSWGPTEIVVTVPYGAADGQVAVEVGGVSVVSPADQTFDYSEPSLTSLNPTEDWVQHNYITITGDYFGPAPSSGGSDTHIYFGTAEAQSGDINEATWTKTNIDVKVPAAATGTTVDVKVVVAGNNSNTLTFTILPHIDSVSPTSGNTGDTLTLSGTNFGDTQGSGGVTIGGTTMSVNSWSNTSVSVDVPANALDGDVVLTRDDTKTTNGGGFDVIPTISGFSPSRRMEGEDLTIDGSGFGDSQGTSTVTFNGGSVVVTTYVSWSNSEIVVEVPTGAETGTITVTIDDTDTGGLTQDSATTGGNVTIVLAPPDLTNIGQL